MVGGRISQLIFALGLAAALCSCAANKSAWQHYDECATQNLSFADMVACGKQRRATYCEPNHTCSDEGNAIVMYADSLVQSVSRRELSEPEARRKWIEFRMARADTQKQLAVQAAAAAARSAPTTCTTIGATTNCY
jgi:hypothetical protein